MSLFKFGMFLFLILFFRPIAWLGYQVSPSLLVGEAIISRLSFGTIFNFVPEPLALIEHLTDRDLPGIGSCRIDNVAALGSDGHLLIGIGTSKDGKSFTHVWGLSPYGELVDVTCPSCRDRQPQAVLRVAGYVVQSVQFRTPEGQASQQNIRYLRTALAVRRLRAMLRGDAGTLRPQRVRGWQEGATISKEGE